MAFQKGLHQIQAELEQMIPHICLKLPASRESVEKQAYRLASIQKQLELIQEGMFWLYGVGGTHSSMKIYNALSQQLEQMLQNVASFRMLAEEYSIDPEGATACLQKIGGRQPVPGTSRPSKDSSP